MITLFKMKHVASALVLAGLASVGSAATAQTVVSGGATLPELLYNEEITTFSPPVSTAFFGYVGTGSGSGKLAFLNNTPGTFGRTGNVHWVGSDSALASDTEVDPYLTTGLGDMDSPTSDGPLIQIPAMATPVNIYFRAPTSLNVELNSDQLCQVFSGGFDNWSDLGFPAAAITVIYRSVSSGTTQLLTRHLQQVCNAGNTANGANFAGQSTFAEVFPLVGGVRQVPANFVPAAESEDVSTILELSATTSAIAYLSPDPDYLDPNTVVQTASLFNPTELAANPSTAVAHAPTEANVQAALGVYVPPSGTVANGEVVKNPDDAGWAATNNPGNPVNWVQLTPNPPSGYPIVGTTNFILSQCYANSTETTAVRSYLQQHYGADALVRAHGFVPLAATTKAVLLNNFLNGTGSADIVARQLSIGNTAFCANFAGRG